MSFRSGWIVLLAACLSAEQPQSEGELWPPPQDPITPIEREIACPPDLLATQSVSAWESGGTEAEACEPAVEKCNAKLDAALDAFFEECVRHCGSCSPIVGATDGQLCDTLHDGQSPYMCFSKAFQDSVCSCAD